MHTAKHIFILIASLLFSQQVFGQVDSVYTGMPNSGSKKNRPKRDLPDWMKDKISYGGFIMPGYAVSSYGSFTSLAANPNIGYRVTDELTLGIGANYYYTSLKTSLGKYSQSIYGPNVFCRYKILKNSFLQMEYDKMNQPDYYAGNDSRAWVDYLYVGGGYFQSVGGTSGLLVSFMYNLTPSRNSVFLNRTFNIGFVSGF